MAVVPHFLAHSWACRWLEWVTWQSRDGQRVCAVMWRSFGGFQGSEAVVDGWVGAQRW